MDKSAPNYEIEGVRRAVAVLRALAERGGNTSLADLSRTLDMDKTVLFRLVHTLGIEGLVKQDPDTKRYRLGPDLAFLGQAAADSFDLRREARPVMEWLTALLGFPAFLNVAGSADVVCIEHVASLSSIDLYGRVGITMPYHACPSGYVLLAWGPPDRLAMVNDGAFQPYASSTPKNAAQLKRILNQTRVNGYAFGEADLEEGVASMASPIFGPHDQAIASLGIAGLSQMFNGDRDELTAQLIAAAQEISRQAGTRHVLQNPAPHTPTKENHEYSTTR